MTACIFTMRSRWPRLTFTCSAGSMNLLSLRRRNVSADELIEEMTLGIPIRRINEPEDVAGLCIYLASDAARNITGQSFNVDGGIIMS